MEVAALVSFGALLVAWIVAPSSSIATGEPNPTVRDDDTRSITGARALPEVPSAT